MMDDYISREAALNTVHNVPKGNWSNARYAHELQAVPAADVAPVKHGTWLPIVEANEDGSPYQAGVFCSKCGHPECVETNYCCYCGAVMDGGAKDAID